MKRLLAAAEQVVPLSEAVGAKAGSSSSSSSSSTPFRSAIDRLLAGHSEQGNKNKKSADTLLTYCGIGAVLLGHPNEKRREKSLALMAQRFIMIFMRVSSSYATNPAIRALAEKVCFVLSGRLFFEGVENSNFIHCLHCIFGFPYAYLSSPDLSCCSCPPQDTTELSPRELRSCALTLEDAAHIFVPKADHGGKKVSAKVAAEAAEAESKVGHDEEMKR